LWIRIEVGSKPDRQLKVTTNVSLENEAVAGCALNSLPDRFVELMLAHGSKVFRKKLFQVDGCSLHIAFNCRLAEYSHLFLGDGEHTIASLLSARTKAACNTSMLAAPRPVLPQSPAKTSFCPPP